MILPTHWVKRNGHRVKIIQMSDGHLRNTIELIDRKIKKKGYDVFTGDPTPHDLEKFFVMVELIKEFQLAMKKELWKRMTARVMRVKS